MGHYIRSAQLTDSRILENNLVEANDTVNSEIFASYIFAKFCGKVSRNSEITLSFTDIGLFVCLLLYVPSQQLWSLRDGQFT